MHHFLNAHVHVYIAIKVNILTYYTKQESFDESGRDTAATWAILTGAHTNFPGATPKTRNATCKLTDGNGKV